MNQPFDPAKFEALLVRVVAHMRERDLYVLDLFAGADEHYRLPVQIIAEYAWHALFVKQLFVRLPGEELASHKPEFTVIAAPEFEAVPERDGTHSSTFIITDFTRRIILIGGTKYAGEMKKSIFGVMNFLLARARRLSYALLGQPGGCRRHGAVLRTLRHRQNHAFRRSAAAADRRRRARLECERHLQH